MEKQKEGNVIQVRNDMRGKYLVAEINGESGYKIEMLKNSGIQGLLPVKGQEMDGRYELWYETYGMQPLKEKFRQNAPGVGEIRSLMSQLEDLAFRLEEYLLEADELVLELSYIFEKEKDCYLFLYLPGRKKVEKKGADTDFVSVQAEEGGKEASDGLYRLLEEMMEYMDYENHRAVSFLYLLHARSRQQMCGMFSLRQLCAEICETEQAEEKRRMEEDFLAELSEMPEKSRKAKKENEKTPVQEKKEITEEKEMIPQKETLGVFIDKIRMFWGKMKKRIGAEKKSEAPEELYRESYGKDFDDEQENTVLLNTDEVEKISFEQEETVLLCETERCTLEPENDGRECILLSVFPFCIGKDAENCDCVLHEPVISRRHAQISKEGMKYYLTDTKSLNGTFWNGERLRAGEKTEIKSGDLIGFADIRFIFTCSKMQNGI